jgi:hypothetical protein
MSTAYRSDSGTLGSARRTPQGGLIVPANLTRTGVFTYDYADGTRVRELRHPDEVFKADSLDSLTQAPLTVLHPSTEVTPATWKQVSVGHVDGTPKPEGQFVAADLRIQDGDTISKVDAKSLTELSCGYRCTVVPGQGEWNGEKYDARQTNIVYNHVAIGPKDWGRAGNSVKIRTDGSPVWLSRADAAPTEEAILAGKSPAFVEGYMKAKREIESGTRADAGPAGPAAPVRDVVREAEEEVRYQNLHGWKGPDWLKNHPFDPTPRNDAVDLVIDGVAEGTWLSRHAYKGDAWIEAQTRHGAKPWRKP